jgi:hypothetical protein
LSDACSNYHAYYDYLAVGGVKLLLKGRVNSDSMFPRNTNILELILTNYRLATHATWKSIKGRTGQKQLQVRQQHML